MEREQTEAAQTLSQALQSDIRQWTTNAVLYSIEVNELRRKKEEKERRKKSIWRRSYLSLSLSPPPLSSKCPKCSGGVCLLSRPLG